MSPTCSSNRHRGFQRLTLATALLVFFAMLSAPAAGARVVAHATISRAHGGTVRAHDGAELYVPPGARMRGTRRRRSARRGPRSLSLRSGEDGTGGCA